MGYERYSRKTKQDAHKLFIKGLSLSEVAREMNVPRRTLHEWRDKDKWYEPAKLSYPEYPVEVKERAKKLFTNGYSLTDIRRDLNLPASVLRNWKNAGSWQEDKPVSTVEIALSQRINALAEIDNKSPEQLNEFLTVLDAFGKLQIKLSTSERIKSEAIAIQNGFPIYTSSLGSSDPYEPRVIAPKPERKPREKKIRNDVSGITEEVLDKVRDELFYGYQKTWWEHRTDRIRLILKSRQIGATYYFAWEALNKAIITGKNQLFLSASRDQAEVFKAYIIMFAMKYFSLELKGQGVILLSNGAELRFLSTNSTTAQSYHGDLYIDEFFWIPNFKRLKKVASGMAAHKRWTITQFSSPSAISHEAYAEWSGELYNQGKREQNRVAFDISHDALKNGAYGTDGKWRHMVTVYDAEAAGCDLFDIEALKVEYSNDDFANLFECKFIDDSQSVFSLAKLLDCTVALDDWRDYKDGTDRPFGNKPVALGYDPSRTRDNSSLAMLAVPLTPSDKWRALRIKNYHGKNFQYQAARIKEVRDNHHVIHIGIDTTGIGHGVFELVQDWFPLATPIHYSMDMKTQLVIKALDVINNDRFRYLAGDHEITRAFLMITQTTTSSGQLTYASSRSVESGHADIAWSIMHGLIYEPINNNSRRTTATFSNV
jgi:uncharacterized protein YjcR